MTRRSRHYRRRNRRHKYSKGKKARAICDRSGFEHAYKDMVVEPGTGLLVYKRWSDGRWNKVDHPQNFPADVGEAVGLKNPRPDTPSNLVEFLRDEDGDIIVGGDGLPIFIE